MSEEEARKRMAIRVLGCPVCRCLAGRECDGGGAHLARLQRYIRYREVNREWIVAEEALLRECEPTPAGEGEKSD